MRTDRSSTSLLRRLGPWALAAAVAAPALAQEPPPSIELELASYDSGRVVNRSTRPEVVISRTVHVAGAEWLRLAFNAVELAGDPERGTGALLRITSFADGAVQEMNSVHLAQWQNTSAYFNGDTLQIDIEAQPGTGASRLVLGRAWAGMGNTKSQCGATDNRVLSNDPRSARALPIGCSAWILDDCKHCMGTAGHCSTSSLQVIQFNVPLSSAGGSLNNPPPEDQYAVDVSSKQSQNSGIGSDWGYFGVFANSNTGLFPHQKQGAWYTLTPPPAFGGGQTIRITGYGVDSTPSQNNQVQQTSTGPWTLLSGSRLEYQVDTEGGNSGSPVIHESSGLVIGVHTNAGCSTSGSGSNSGTGRNNPNWSAAMASPKGVCLGAGSFTTYCTAKLNSQLCFPLIAASGSPTTTGGAGSFTISSSQQINNANGLLIYGFSQASTPFQGGFLCIGGQIIRTQVQSSGGTSGAPNCSGTYSFDMGALIFSGSDPGLVSGATVYTQYWGRDVFLAPPNATSLTQGLRFTIGC
jgi:hypothetical protein